MSDLISRQDALKKLREHRDIFCKNRIEFSVLSKDEKARVDEIDNCIAVLTNIPSVEPERKKGRWQRRKGSDCWECSQCHAVLESDDIVRHNFYYCYHCGADMMSKDGWAEYE